MDPDIEPDIDCIDGHLYLGGLSATVATKTLKSNGITHILTVDTEPLAGHLKEKCQYRTLYIQADDRPHVDLLSHFEEANEFIDDGIKNGAVLVHCFFGVSRSATLIIAYIMKTTNLSVQEAVARVKEKRPVIGPNPGFMAQLQLYGKMSCNLDLNNPEYKLYRLEQFTAALKKGRNYDAVSDIVAKDPSLKDNSFTDLDVLIYKCKSCRRSLFTNKNALEHLVGQKPTWLGSTWPVEEESEEDKCPQGFYIEPMEWMTGISCSQGKLLCPKCTNKIGNFNWLGNQCVCGIKVVPTFHIIPSKIDECKINDEGVASL